MKAGTKANEKHKETISTQKKKDSYFWVILVVLGIISIISYIPTVADNKVAVIFLYILENLILTGTVIGYSFFCSKVNRVKGFGIALSVVSIIYFWVKDLLPLKEKINVLTVIMSVTIIYALVIFLLRGIKSKVMSGISCYYLLVYLLIAKDFSLTEEKLGVIEIIAVVVAVLITVLAIYLVLKNKNLKDLELSEKIALPILVFFVSTGLLLSGFINLNHSLERGQPVEDNYTIADKAYLSSYRGPSYHNFYFEINGEKIGVNVSGSDYNSYEIGDKYTVRHSDGFFNAPYYYSCE